MHGICSPVPLTTLKVQPPLKVVTGQRLAKSSVGYPPYVRAEDAERWRRGEAQVKPTAKLACAVFNVSYARLREAQARLDRNRHHVDWKHVNGNGNAAPVLSDDVVERIVAEVGVDRIWRVIDKLTQPTLPLQPAK